MASIEVVDGCLFRVTGLSSEQGAEIIKSWDFDNNCEVEVRTRVKTEKRNGTERKNKDDS